MIEEAFAAESDEARYHLLDSVGNPVGTPELKIGPDPLTDGWHVECWFFTNPPGPYTVARFAEREAAHAFIEGVEWLLKGDHGLGGFRSLSTSSMTRGEQV